MTRRLRSSVAIILLLLAILWHVDVLVPEAGPSPDLYTFLGAESCSGSACHGSATPRTKLKIRQNEFYVWSQKDSHFKAYEVLTKPDAQRIADNLKIEKPEASRRCLVCHALSVEPERQGSLFDVTEGVTCEACHGAAEKWLGPHTRRDWDVSKAVSVGMYNTKDLAKRSEKCLSCHLGADTDVVTHELIGAGHPRLKFELDNYTHAMPPHWKTTKDKAERNWTGTRAWAVGQAVAFRNQIRLLLTSRKSAVGIWPDFVHFDCYACHHDVVDHVRDLNDDQKRIQRWRTGEYGGKPGRLVWNASSYAVFQHLVHQVAPAEGKQLDQLVRAFHEALTGKQGTAEGLEGAMRTLVDLTEQLVPRIAEHSFTEHEVLALMRAIAADAPGISRQGFQSAEQAVLSLASLYDSYTEAVGARPEINGVKDSIDALYKDIKEGRTFNAAQFVTNMNRLSGQLSKTVDRATAS